MDKNKSKSTTMFSKKLPQNKTKENDLKLSVIESYVTKLKDPKNPGDNLKLKFIDTPLGLMVAVSNDKLLSLKNINSKHMERDLKHLMKTYSKPIVEDGTAAPLQAIETELAAYFKGELTEFQTPLHIDPTETEFQRSVWSEIHKIKYGETSNYTELARSIGNPKSFRAVANACGRNPIAIVIPCHRVRSSGDKLGGYSCGIEKKVWLLDHEERHK